MPNKDGTGPAGKGPGTGRLRGGCISGQDNNRPNPGKGQGRRSPSGNKGNGAGSGGIRKGFDFLTDKTSPNI